MHIRGTYQGMEILDGEFSMRVGVEPSRGWIRVLLSEMGGKLPTQVDADQMREQFNRKNRQNPMIQASWSPIGQVTDTLSNVAGNPPPQGKNALAGIWGDLTLNTQSTGGGSGTSVTLQNIFWLEAVIEEQHLGGGGDQFGGGGEAVVRVELADERVLWDLGGFVMGRRNYCLNDIADSVAGKILEWDPAIENPTAIKDIAAATTEKDTSRPILDPKTIFQLKTPYLLAQMLLECCEMLPGPPRFTLPDSGKVMKIGPYNVDYEGATMAKKALEDLLNRYNLILAPDYNGGYQVYDRGESARSAGGGIADPFSGVAQEFMSDKSVPAGAVSLQITPLAVEVVGEKIIEEIACPHWVMVVKDDGIDTGTDTSGFARKVGHWVLAEEYVKNFGYTMERASSSLMANYEMHSSKVYDDIPISDKEKKEKVKATLRKHLFKSFMVSPIEGGEGGQTKAQSSSPVGVNQFRSFLPMILKRAGSMSHALNMPNMAIGRDFTVYCDGWTPDRIRRVGQGPFYGNVGLEQVDMDDMVHVDPKYGVITFREPRGSLAYLDKYAFTASSGLVQAVIEETYGLWRDKASSLAGKIQEQFDTFLYKLGDNRDYYDTTAAVRMAMSEFIREVAKVEIPDAVTLEISKRNLTVAGANVVQNFKESLPILGLNPGQGGSVQNFNLSEMKLVTPRILAIWGWERNFGRSDDYYRYRTGIDPGSPPFPIKVGGLRQYIDLTGATNKDVLDVLAKMNADEFLEKRTGALEGATLKWAGFHQIALSGTIPEVAWRFSNQTGEAETETHVNRYQHGIKGRPAAVATWTAFQKPLPKVGR